MEGQSSKVPVSERTWGFNSPLAHQPDLRDDPSLEPAVRAQVRSGGRADLVRVAVRGLHSVRTPTLESSRPPTLGGR